MFPGYWLAVEDVVPLESQRMDRVECMVGKAGMVENQVVVAACAVLGASWPGGCY